MEDIIKIVKSLEDSGLLLKGVSETIQNEAKEQKGAFLPSMQYMDYLVCYQVHQVLVYQDIFQQIKKL